jgi:hypothetical protein
MDLRLRSLVKKCLNPLTHTATFHSVWCIFTSDD